MTADRTNDTGILPKGFNSPAHCDQKVNFTLISLKVEVFSAANIRFTGRGSSGIRDFLGRGVLQAIYRCGQESRSGRLGAKVR